MSEDAPAYRARQEGKGAKLYAKFGRFTGIPDTVTKMIPCLGTSAFTLYVYLCYRADGETDSAFPGYRRIGLDTGMSTRTIAKAIQHLCNHGLLTRIRRGQGHPNLYIIQYPALPEVCSLQSTEQDVYPVQHNKTQSNKTHDSPDSSLRSESGTPSLSEERDEDVPESNVEKKRKRTRAPLFPRPQSQAMFAALAAAFGPSTNEATRGRYNRAAKCLLQSGATPETVAQLVKNARAKGWKSEHITPLSIASHYEELLNGPVVVIPTPTNAWTDKFGVEHRLRGGREEYFHPAGAWVDFATGESIDGGYADISVDPRGRA